MDGVAAPDPQPGDWRAVLLALKAQMETLDATAAADTQLLAALHEAENLMEIAKDSAVRAVQAANASNTAIGAALGVTKQAISRRWPRSRATASDDRAPDAGEAATSTTPKTAARGSSRPQGPGRLEKLTVSLPLLPRVGVSLLVERRTWTRRSD